ncbi:hypothetical protein ACI65C_008909 [Semiaphis heraclei]
MMGDVKTLTKSLHRLVKRFFSPITPECHPITTNPGFSRGSTKGCSRTISMAEDFLQHSLVVNVAKTVNDNSYWVVRRRRYKNI